MLNYSDPTHFGCGLLPTVTLTKSNPREMLNSRVKNKLHTAHLPENNENVIAVFTRKPV